MSYNMLADSRPLFCIGGREDAVRLYLRIILYSNAKSVIGLYPTLYKRAYKQVGVNEIIGCGIVFVSIKIPEYIRHVNVAVTAKRTAYIVKPRIFYAHVGKIVKRSVRVISYSGNRRLTDRVHILYLANGLIKIYTYFHNFLQKEIDKTSKYIIPYLDILSITFI